MKTTTLIGLCMIMALVAMCGTSSAWISDYDYRMQIDINNTGDTLIDYQYNFTVNTAALVSAGKMQADGGDCRITNATDVPQPFWNETAFNNSSTKIWVNASIGNATNTTHYFYYGNSGASSVQNITTTMMFGDDFSENVDGFENLAEASLWSGSSPSDWLGRPCLENYTADNVWIATYVQGDARAVADQILHIRFSTDEGVTWSAADTYTDGSAVGGFPISGHDSYSVGEALLIQAPNGDLIIQSIESNSFQVGSVDMNGVYQWSSTDGGGNWTDDGRSFQTSTLNIADYVTVGSDIYITASYDPSGDYTTPVHSQLYNSSDNGGNWSLVSNITTISENPPNQGWCECAIEYCGNNTFLTVIRGTTDAGGVLTLQRKSTDMGETWGALVDITSSVGDHRGRGQLIKMPGEPNRLYLTHRNQAASPEGIAIYHTDDCGDSWSSKFLLNTGTSQTTDYVDIIKRTNGTYYAIYSGGTSVVSNIRESIYQCAAVYGLNSSKWASSGAPTIVSGEVQLSDDDSIISIGTFGFETIVTARSKANEQDSSFVGYYASANDRTAIENSDYIANDDFTNIMGIFYKGAAHPSPWPQNNWLDFRNTYYQYTIKRINTSHIEYGQGSNTTIYTDSAYIATGDMSVKLYAWDSSQESTLTSDWIFVRQYAATEPISSLGAEEASTVEYIPPTPTSLTNTTGNFWVNHTWSAGSGNITDSYNVSVNDVWHNTSPAYYNDTYSAHAWQNITVYAYSTSGNGSLSPGNISQNTQIPNNQITITNASDWSGDAGENVYVDYDATDADSDTPTFSCNRTDLFTDFNTADGTGNWSATAGTYYADFGVSDGYGSSDNYTMVIAAGITEYIPPTPTSLTNTTGNFWVNHTWSAGSGNITDSYNVSVNDVWHNTSPAYYNDTYSAHAWQNITVYAFNSTGAGTLSTANISQNTRIPNNPITITNTSDKNVNEGENVYVDYDATDADSDTPTFSCNRTDLFTDFSTSTGKANWSTGYADAGTYYVDFGVSDGYGSSDNYTMAITVNEYGVPGTPTSLANTTGNFWVNHTWSPGGNTDTYNVSVNTVWYNATSVTYNNTTASPHAWVNISLAGYNTTTGNISSFATQDTQIPNNPITITNTSDWSDDAGENVYVDYDAIDADSDTPTFSCNRTDMFSDFSTSTGEGNWTSVAGTHYVDFGVSDGYGSTDNYTMTITVGVPSAFTISLHSVSPETIQTNYTGEIKVNYLVESTNPLNLSSLALLYGINYTTTGDMHSYIAAPANSIASEGIYRAPNRNSTPYLSWENNATITEGNVWQWGGGDNNSWWITKTPINATHTWVNVTGIPEHAFQSSFYLKKTAMYSAPKTAFNINSQQGIIIKMWDNEVTRGRSIDYIMNLYFDSGWQSTIPTSPIEIWGLNSSFNPDTDDPTTSEFSAKIVEWDGNRWVNHSWVPGSNASYAHPLVLGASSYPVIPDEVNYIYLKSGTQTSKSYVLNATNHDPGICNITYAQTETMWTYNELSGTSNQVAYTPSFFTTFVRDDEQFLHHLYIADDQGAWAHSGINNISIGVSHYPVDASSFEYFNVTCPTLGYTLDTGMGSTYDNGHMHIGIYCHADPDGGNVSHNITLHYTNGTLVGIVNNTFQTTSPGLYEINFTTTPYYSTADAYILKCVSTDDEAEAATTWLDSFFTLAADGTQGYYVNDYLMFWGMNDIPTLYTVVANNSLISYDAGDDIYTMHMPFFKSKCNDTFRFNETVHLKSLNTEDVAYFRFGGETIFDNANIHGWNTTTDTLAPSTDTYRAYMYSCCRTTGNITNSNLSYLGSDVYEQEGLNFLDNSADYLIYNTTLSHNNRGIIVEECENFNLSHCNIHNNAEVGIGIYYSNNTVVENSTITDSGYDPCIYLYEASNNIIRYNTIQNCVDYGIQVRSNSNNNIFTGNNVTGSGIYDYYFRAASVNNSIIDPASMTDRIRSTITSEVNIENTDNAAFTEDSPNSTYAYPTNFSMHVAGVSQTFNITQHDLTVTPDADSVQIWNLVFGNVVTFNATNSTGSPPVWFNITQSTWGNANISIYRDDVVYANETADPLGHIAYNYSGGWSEHWFEFASPNAAPDKPAAVTPVNGATGTSTNPTLTVQVTDDNSVDLLNVTFYAQGGTQIGSTQTGIANAATASVVWSGRSYSNTYYWYAVADDGTAQTQSDTWHFTTQGSGSGSSHVISIAGCTDWEGNAGTQVYIDFGCTGETAGATFSTNATNGSIDSSTGIYTWNPTTADTGVYNWRFDVENVYSVSDYCDVTVTVYHYASPTNLAATTGNFWVNHTWDGNGFVDSYNVNVNGVWTNGSTDQHSYHVRSPHAWSNISVAAYNDTTGLSSFVSNDVQVPNNAIVLTNYTVLMLATAGNNVTVDMNHEDLDGDTATYYCSRMDLFADFNTADGTGQYTDAINGTHEVIFGVTDGYGWSNQTITIEVGTVHPLELDEETPLLLFVVLVVLLFGSLFYIYHAASYVAKIVTALISTWMSFMLSNMAVSGNVVLNYAELSSGDAFVYGTHSIQIAALSHFFMFTGVVSALFMLAFAVKLVIDTYNDMQEKRKAEEEWDGVEEQ